MSKNLIFDPLLGFCLRGEGRPVRQDGKSDLTAPHRVGETGRVAEGERVDSSQQSWDSELKLHKGGLREVMTL